jgi:UDP:flavonoid glycosyltransferase YjiC (YdhE family)
MKALFTTFPAYGHLLPMLPLARAAAAGDEVVIAAPEDLHATAGGLAVRALGPSLPDLLAENESRFRQDVLGFRSDSSDLLDATVALFTTTRADMAFDELLALAADERPDVIVAEMWDYVAPLVARRLGIPWVTFVHSPATPIGAALEGGLVRALEQRALAMPPGWRPSSCGRNGSRASRALPLRRPRSRSGLSRTTPRPRPASPPSTVSAPRCS